MPVRHVGRPLKRIEDPKLIRGADPYVNDVRLQDAAKIWQAMRSAPKGAAS